MNIIVAHATGFSVDNNSEISNRMIPVEKGMRIERTLKPMALFHVVSEPTKECQVLTDTNKGFFCIFESNQKLRILKDMTEQEIQDLKHNLRKWH